MTLHHDVTKDGHRLWGVFLSGRRNDDDGGIDIKHQWFMIAPSEAAVRKALADEVQQVISRYTGWYNPPTVVYRVVSPGALTLCYPGSGGRLQEVSLHPSSSVDVSLTAVLMDSRA